MSAPSKLTPEIIVKLEEVAELDGSVAEMASYCDVSRETIYQWLKKDKKLSDRIERLRERPILKARRTINKKMEDSYANAMDYAKRKRKKEFGDSSTVEITTPKPLLDVLSENEQNTTD